MSGMLIGQLILWLIVALIVIAVAVYVVNWLYHRFPRRAGGDQRRRLCAAIHSRVHAGQHERAADADHSVEAGRRDHPRSHAHRHRSRLLCPGAADTRGGRDCRGDARPANAGTRKAAYAALRQVRFRHALGRLGNDHGADAREARRIRRARQGRGRRSAGPERPRARIGGDHRPRSDRPRILQPVEPLRRGRPDPADGGHRGQAQTAQRHRTGLDDQDPDPQSRSRTAGARDRT